MKIEYDIETEMFPESFPIPRTQILNESSEINNYRNFFSKYYNK